jgi:hypothetical protein
MSGGGRWIGSFSHRLDLWPAALGNGSKIVGSVPKVAGTVGTDSVGGSGSRVGSLTGSNLDQHTLATTDWSGQPVQFEKVPTTHDDDGPANGVW